MSKFTLPLIGVALLLIAGCKTAPQQQAGEPNTTPKKVPTTVTAMALVPRTLDERVEVTGTLQPDDQVDVGTRSAGRIAWIIGKEGMKVQRGKPVARLEDTDARSQVRAAKAALAAARARVEQAEAAVLQQTTATDSGVATARAGVAAAKARLRQAQAAAEAQDASAKAQVKAAQAMLDAANSRLALLKNGSRSQERTIAENNVKLAQATFDLDKSNYERYKTLYDKGAVSRSVLDGMETKMRLSETQWQSAKQSLSMVQEGARTEDIQGAQAAVRQAQEGVDTARANLKQTDVANANVEIAKTGVAQAEAALDAAKATGQVNVMRDKDVLAARAGVQQAQAALATADEYLRNMTIFSPVDGVVATRMAEVGQSLGNGDPVLRLTTNNALYFEAQVSELDAPRLRAGQTVMLAVDALQGERGNLYSQSASRLFAGTVEKVVPVVNAQTRNFTVRVVVPRSAQLCPGMFARGSVVTATHLNAVTVPKDALVKREGKTYVFVAAKNAASQRDVILGASDATAVQVISGVQPGEMVIVEGQQTLKDGDTLVVKGKK